MLFPVLVTKHRFILVSVTKRLFFYHFNWQRWLPYLSHSPFVRANEVSETPNRIKILYRCYEFFIKHPSCVKSFIIKNVSLSEKRSFPASAGTFYYVEHNFTYDIE